MRLIDADALIQSTKNFCDGYKVHWTDKKVLAWIDHAPTITPESLVVHGRWKDGYCTNCGSEALCNGVEEEVLSPYCALCGAKMDLEQNPQK